MATKSEQRGEQRGGLFATKPVDRLVADTEESAHQLKRAVGLLDLTALGIGAIIGTGIFVILGEAIGDAGPAIILSFVLAGVTCAFSALSYAELASSIPVSGSAYTYGYATMGELVAWIIGWDLILEYGVSVAAVAVGWGQYFNELLDTLFGLSLPDSLANPPGEDGGAFNLPAVFLVLAVTALLIVGVRESARANAVMVMVKVAIVILFIILAFTGFDSGNLHAVQPRGLQRRGHRRVGDLLRVHRLRRDLHLGRGGQAAGPGPADRDHRLARDLHAAVHPRLHRRGRRHAVQGPRRQEAPLAEVLKTLGLRLGRDGDLLRRARRDHQRRADVLYGQTRIMFAMCRDGLLPRSFAKISEKRRTPVRITATFGILIAVLAAFVPLEEIAKLVNIGTLFAFVITNIGVIVLRRTRPDLERGFRVPLVPLFPIIGAGLAIFLMKYLERRHVDPVRRLAADRLRHLLRLRAPALAAAARPGGEPGGRPGLAQVSGGSRRGSRPAGELFEEEESPCSVS